MGSLSRRVGTLEATRVDLLFRREARRLAAQYGGSAGEILKELHAWSHEVAWRFGPRPDLREVAHWMAKQKGLDPDEVYAHMMALKEEQ